MVWMGKMEVSERREELDVVEWPDGRWRVEVETSERRGELSQGLGGSDGSDSRMLPLWERSGVDGKGGRCRSFVGEGEWSSASTEVRGGFSVPGVRRQEKRRENSPPRARGRSMLAGEESGEEGGADEEGSAVGDEGEPGLC